MSESHGDQILRVRQMVEGYSSSLSQNDFAALRTVLEERDALLSASQAFLVLYEQGKPHMVFDPIAEQRARQVLETSLKSAVAKAEGRYP